jgi:hypothetical protein
MAGLQRVVSNLGVLTGLGNCPDGQEDIICSRENVLHQIAVRTGHAALAATHIHNSTLCRGISAELAFFGIIPEKLPRAVLRGFPLEELPPFT